MLKQIANKRCQNKGNWILYKMAISDFQNFWFWPPKFQKTSFFLEKCSKIQNFQNFQKTVSMYRTQMRVVGMPNFKSVYQFLTPRWLISVKCGDVIKINHIFGPFIDIVHNKQITPLDSWDEIESEKCVLFSKFWILNFENWPFLTFFDLTLRSNLKITATIGFYV